MTDTDAPGVVDDSEAAVLGCFGIGCIHDRAPETGVAVDLAADLIERVAGSYDINLPILFFVLGDRCGVTDAIAKHPHQQQGQRQTQHRV